MANRFSDIAKQMGAKVDEGEAGGEVEREVGRNELVIPEPEHEAPPEAKRSKQLSVKENAQKEQEIPMTRKTTALPLVLDIAIKEVKERRNIASKIKKSKKITEDDVVVEALELYFKKAENKSYLESAYEKLKYLG